MQIETPELDKMSATTKESQIIGQFLEYSGYVLAEYHEDYDYMLVPVGKTINQILADYFDIDLNKVEQERRAILDAYLGGNVQGEPDGH